MKKWMAKIFCREMLLSGEATQKYEKYVKRRKDAKMYEQMQIIV